MSWGIRNKSDSGGATGADGLRRLLARGGGATAVAGVFDPLSALIAERAGFEALYFSGAAFSARLGIPDIGLFTLDELASAVRWVTRATSLPLIVDADTGFGGALNAYRTVAELESAGAAAIQLEDQAAPKRCGHLDGKRVVDAGEFAAKLRAADAARKSALLVARTDAKAVLGMEEAIRRGAAYRAAGADVIFPEALESADEFARYAQAADAPLLANMTEFGKTPYLTVDEFGALGYKLVIFPATALRAAAGATRDALSALLSEGTQKNLLGKMQTRAELYDLIGYADYQERDRRFADDSGGGRGISARGDCL